MMALLLLGTSVLQNIFDWSNGVTRGAICASYRERGFSEVHLMSRRVARLGRYYQPLLGRRG